MLLDPHIRPLFGDYFSFDITFTIACSINPATVISYQLSVVSDVTLEIYNLLGKKIATLVDARQGAGEYRVAWDGRDDDGNPVATGMYLYRLRAGDLIQTRKMTLVK